MFRVVQDQLRVSEGWVRCGRCAEVFNAVEHLVDVEAETRAREASRSTHRERVIQDLVRISGQMPLADDGSAPSGHEPSVPLKGDDDGADAAEVEISAAESTTASTPVAWEPSRDTPEEPTERSTEPTVDESNAQVEAAATPTAVAEAAPSPAPEPPAPTTAVPVFVRQAERAARWRQPGVRNGLAAAAAGAALLLVAQLTFEYRDLAAARWPGLRPALERACAARGCEVGPPRVIEALAVESSGLVRDEDAADYRLSVVVRNRSTFDLALPALDLTLTDSRGGVIARRVLRVADFGAAPRSVAGGGELTLQAALAAGERRVSGYTIELFYP